MSSREEEIIRRYFSFPGDPGVVCGIGDDAAVVRFPGDSMLTVSTDTLNSGIHFFENTDPRRLGRKSLAVSLSDIAAMGSCPLYATVSLSHPDPSDLWLENFSAGIKEMSGEHKVPVIGGDTCRGNSVSVTTTVFGATSGDGWLSRSGAQPGDSIWVTGTVGDAALALAVVKGETVLREDFHGAVFKKLEDPVPRLDVGRRLVGEATAALDLSDGLLSGVATLANASGLSAVINADLLPRSPALCSMSNDLALRLALCGGDDYELCFTGSCGSISEDVASLSTCIGEMVEGCGVSVLHEGEPLDVRSLEGATHEHWL